MNQSISDGRSSNVIGRIQQGGAANSIVVITGILLLLMILSSNVPARQHQTSLSGLILNSVTKEKVVGANVLIIGSTFGASTDSMGRFVISNIPPGTYEVRVSVLGYSQAIVRGVAVAASRPVEITIPLTEQFIQMSEVVTVGGQLVNVPELNVSTRYLDYREIQHTAGAFDDVLRTITILPGVAQTRIDRNDLSVRGGAASENLHLIDGIEIDNINHFGTQGSGGGTTTFLNLDFVENSFFSGGGFGAQYGDRLSSVLSIDMREGRRDKFRGKATLSATQLGLNLDGPLTENGSYLFSARRSYLDPIFKLYGFSYTPYFWDFLGKASYHIGRSDKIEFLGICVIDRIKRFDETQKQRAENNASILGEETKVVGGVIWQHGFNSGYLNVHACHSYTDFQYHAVGDTLNPTLSNSSYEGETSVKADVLVQVFSSTEVRAGIGARTARLTGSLHTGSMSTGYSEDPHLPPINLAGDTSGYKLSGYAQISQTIGPIVLTAGIRGDYFSMIYERSACAPRFSSTLFLLPETRINLSVGRYFQSPSYIWIMANSYNRGLTHLGMNQYVASLEHSIRNDLIITLEGFLKHYDHYPISLTRPYIVMVNTGAEIEQLAEAYESFGLDYLQSSGTGFSRGVELFVHKKISDSPLYGRLSITYSETQFTALDGVSRPSNYDQRWKLAVNGGYVFDEKWEMNASFRFATGMPYTPFGSADWIRPRDAYNTARTNVNHSLDIRISRRWATGSFVINAFADIQNIYNRQPSEPPEWNQSENRVAVPSELGIVPSIGVSVEF